MDAGGHPGPGWWPDPWGIQPLRWWDGDQWTGWTGTYQGNPIRYWLVIVPGLLVSALGLVLMAGAVWGLFHPITASPVTLTVRAPLRADDCTSGTPLKVLVDWKGQPVPEEYYQAPSDRDYQVGDHLHAWIGSDGHYDLGPDRNWILHPDTHDPFAIGADGAAVLALALMALGLTMTVAGIRGRRRRQAVWAEVVAYRAESPGLRRW